MCDPLKYLKVNISIMNVLSKINRKCIQLKCEGHNWHTFMHLQPYVTFN